MLISESNSRFYSLLTPADISPSLPQISETAASEFEGSTEEVDLYIPRSDFLCLILLLLILLLELLFPRVCTLCCCWMDHMWHCLIIVCRWSVTCFIRFSSSKKNLFTVWEFAVYELRRVVMVSWTNIVLLTSRMNVTILSSITKLETKTT